MQQQAASRRNDARDEQPEREQPAVVGVVAAGQQPAFTLTHWATAGWEVPEVPAAAMTQEERNARAKQLMDRVIWAYGKRDGLRFTLFFAARGLPRQSPWAGSGRAFGARRHRSAFATGTRSHRPAATS